MVKIEVSDELLAQARDKFPYLRGQNATSLADSLIRMALELKEELKRLREAENKTNEFD